jgi:hypothetical protein
VYQYNNCGIAVLCLSLISSGIALGHKLQDNSPSRRLIGSRPCGECGSEEPRSLTLIIAEAGCSFINPLKPKLVQIMSDNSVRTSKKTPHFFIRILNWLMLIKEITPVFSENDIKTINT